MSETAISLRTGAAPRWHWRRLLLAPHRLAFFLAMGVLAASGAWWAAVQGARMGWWALPPPAVSPTLLHSSVMVLGFVPLFFGGFLFTAGPRWLGVEGPAARQLAPCLLAQAGGWLLWLAGGHVDATLAAAGLLIAAGGLLVMTLEFQALVRESTVEDRVHARCIVLALVFGSACLMALPLALLAGAASLQRGLVLGSLWGFVVPVFVTVAHRMIPFFTSGALPMAQAWRPFWALGLMLGVALFEAGCAWADAFGVSHPALAAVRGAVELAGGAMLLWLAFAWGLVQSMKIRLLGMLHLGFSWLGLGLAISGVAQLGQAATGQAVLPLAALHAITMGCLGSLMLAMVTRVSCGHSGRPLVADGFLWTLFLLLQGATVLRITAAVPGVPAQALHVLAALLWGAVMLAWALRQGRWYASPRADGRPG